MLIASMTLNRTSQNHYALRDILGLVMRQPVMPTARALHKEVSAQLYGSFTVKEVEMAAWTVHPDRLVDMNGFVMRAFYRGVHAASVVDVDLPSVRIKSVLRSFNQAPVPYVRAGRAMQAVSLEQLALLFHVRRLGVVPEQAHKIFKHELPNDAMEKVREHLREHYKVPAERAKDKKLWHWGHVKTQGPLNSAPQVTVA